MWGVVANEARDIGRISTKEEKSEEEIDDLIYSSIINNYEILAKCRKKFVQASTDVKQGLIERLVTFDEESTKRLCLINRRFLLFYLFRVHELVIMLENKTLLAKFNQLLSSLNAVDEYNQLFLPSFSLEELETMLVNVPRDLTNIILGYSNLSIHDPVDVNLVFNKIK
jgi:hypothetical protein